MIDVYNLVPHPGEAALHAFNIPLFKYPIFVSINARTHSDYGLESTLKNITHLMLLDFVEMDLWGVPA